jgi:hypothetical protein
VSGAVTLRIHDASPFLLAMRDRSQPMAERWRRALAAERNFAEERELEPQLEAGEPATADEVQSAEARLGFPLPAAYRELVTGLGPLRRGDSYVPAPADLRTAAATILEDWSHGSSGVPEWMSPKALERLRRGVVLFFDVGDGMGGSMFLAPPGAVCEDDFVGVSLHEESLDQVATLIERDDLVCPSFEEVLAGNLAEQLFSAHESELGDRGELLVDASVPEQKLVLRFDVAEDGSFVASLSRY